jgi:hypothetical protein
MDQEEAATPHVYIQWKGTDVCLDFHCECDAENDDDFGHFDGFFAYHIKCSRCGRVYKLPTQLELTLVQAVESGPDPVVDTKE